MTFDCMSDDELSLWREGAAMVARQTGYETQKPCADCPLSFRLEEYRAGRCCQPPPGTYSEDTRAYKREWMRTYRARADGRTMMSATGPELSVPTLRPGSLHS